MPTSGSRRRSTARTRPPRTHESEERAGSEFTIEEVFRALRERGVAEGDTLAMLRSARIAYWRSLSLSSIAATVAEWTVH